VPRSRTPDGIRQEIYAHVLAHYDVRALVYAAADQAQIDLDPFSFITALQVVVRRIAAQSAFSPR
jgi:hypothetical protein